MDEHRLQPYSDTPVPRRFGAASPVDPQLFATVEGATKARISQSEVAEWLRDLADRSKEHISRIPAKTAESRRWQLDIQILSGLGRFFSEKMMAAASWHEFERTGDQGRLQLAINQYAMARSAWAEFAALARNRYADDITYGTAPHLRGHWMDRLAAIDSDIDDMKKRLRPAPPVPPMMSDRRPPKFTHAAPTRFQPGKDLEIVVQGGDARLFYRHVNQAERWRVLAMEGAGPAFNGRAFPLNTRMRSIRCSITSA